MKKKFWSMPLLLILAFVCCVFAGCAGNPLQFEISVQVLHANLGSVEEQGGTYREGDVVKIKAIPNQSASSSSEFFCWLLNNKVASTNAEYEFTVSSETAGNYIALFTCPYLEYYSLSGLTLNSDVATNSNIQTKIKSLTIYAGELENLLTSMYTLGESLETNLTYTTADIYSTNKMPYAFDIQNDLYLKIEIVYEQDEIEFVSTTTTKIDKTDDLTNNTFELSNLSLTLASNPSNANLKLNTQSNEQQISLSFTRLSSDVFTLKAEEEK